jgi:hypothetical protein
MYQVKVFDLMPFQCFPVLLYRSHAWLFVHAKLTLIGHWSKLKVWYEDAEAILHFDFV